MADPFIALGLTAVPPAVNNYHKAWHPVRNKVKKLPVVRRRKDGTYEKDYAYEEDMTPEKKGWVLKPRREVGSDEEIMEYAGPRSQVQGNELVPRRPGGSMVRRASSVDRGEKEYRWAKGGAAGYEDSSDEETYERSRRGRRDRGGPRSSARSSGRSTHSHGNTTELRSRSSSSSSSLVSSSEDERNCRKMKQKKWLTAGLATVATIHAAQKVYTSLEARDKRTIEVAKGELSPDEARKKQNSARWQDAAAIGIAALGIKGAYGEWHEMAEQREEYKKSVEEREERHRKRVERARRARELGVDYKDMLHPHKSGRAHRSKSEARGRDYGYDDDRRYDDRRR